MTTYLRSNYRITGGKIDESAGAIGSSVAAAAATAIGTVSIAHGMGTAPTVAFGSPIAADTFGAYKYVALKGIDGTYLTFITASAAPGGSADTVQDTCIVSALSSAVVISFVWMAIR